MKKINVNYHKGIAKIKIENLDDLWYLSQIIDKGDLISGTTLRKIKIGEEGDRKQNVVKKPIFIKISLDKLEFSSSQTVLRALGQVEEGPEDIPKGDHHTFNLDINSEITIGKKSWLSYQKDKLDESFDSQISNIIILVFDREEAYFALMGRIDDVINISGHRIGTAEVESALVSHGAVAEAAVVLFDINLSPFL